MINICEILSEVLTFRMLIQDSIWYELSLNIQSQTEPEETIKVKKKLGIYRVVMEI